MYKDKRLGNIYSHMKKRCYAPNCKAYKNYGGRGINLRTLKNRIDLLGWSIERAFEEEVK